MSGQRRLSIIRCSFHDDCIDIVNRQIKFEYVVSCIYRSMSIYFRRRELRMNHLADFFNDLSVKEKEQADWFFHLQLNRRAEVNPPKKLRPRKYKWGDGLNAMKCALVLEKHVYWRLSRIFKLATERNDHQLCRYLQNYYLFPQMQSVKEVANYVACLRQLPTMEPVVVNNYFLELLIESKKE
ncbi:ferritin heavy chain-like [Sorex fumeus]|uniref:ferritin heavy chain-like n=1 Tax=Sorex fumeus TaxID=62283 RepID=UPI0024AD24DF|nr:ferritin heavy chain-like [Sorex fumeus]XP_055987102.1 ferritin heavy chain-like [Sorex fumeus]